MKSTHTLSSFTRYFKKRNERVNVYTWKVNTIQCQQKGFMQLRSKISCISEKFFVMKFRLRSLCERWKYTNNVIRLTWYTGPYKQLVKRMSTQDGYDILIFYFFVIKITSKWYWKKGKVFFRVVPYAHTLVRLCYYNLSRMYP